ncbi:MAG: hypothetical protein ACOYY2_09560 [Actinomycetota bacterium]
MPALPLLPGRPPLDLADTSGVLAALDDERQPAAVRPVRVVDPLSDAG